MPTLVLVRHAKSARPSGVPDIDRPLAARGEVDAGLLGSFLEKAIPTPAQVLTSPARRTRDTAAAVGAAAGWTVGATTDDRLYYGGIADLFAVLNDFASPVTVAFGHEPTWSTAVSTLIGGCDVRMVTASAACLDTTGYRPGAGTLS